jgi:hypothetical protein
MVGLINPNNPTSLETQKSFALNSSFQLSPGESLPDGVTLPTLPPASVSSTGSVHATANAATTSLHVTGSNAPSATESSEVDAPISRNGVSTNEIIGIVIGSLAGVTLFVWVFGVSANDAEP